MSPNFQSSFIPKESVTKETFKKKKTGLLGVLVVLLFIGSIVAYIGLYVYKGMVKSEIENLKVQLVEAEKNVDKKTIDELSQFSKKLNFAKTIVLKHQVVSKFLDTLASSTVSALQFESFSYGNLEQGKLDVNLEGKATGYSSIALQEDIFSKNKFFKSLTFSDLMLANKGLVSFKLLVSVDPQISIYSP